MDNDALRQEAIKELARRELARRRSIGQQKPIAAETAGGYDDGAFRAATEGAQSGLMFGFDDELTGAMLAPIEATKDWMQGEGFDLGGAYREIRDKENTRKQSRRETHPVASMAGEIAGGVGTGGAIAKNIGTLAGRGILPAAIEGAGYGAAHGAGEADPGQRGEGALFGAVTGAVTGGAMEGIGRGIAARGARKAAEKARGAVPAQTSEEMGMRAIQLYETMRQTGAKLPKASANKAKANIDILLKKETNRNLSPEAFSLKQQVDKVFSGKDVDIIEWHNLSKQVNRIARDKNLKADDKHFVGIIKKQIDKLRDGKVIGGPKASKMWKEANDLVVRQKKVEVLDDALDMAELKTGQYTQAELAHTIAQKFRQIYGDKQLRAQFSPEEQAIIRNIGQAKTHSALVNQLKKLAPRSIVSAALGAGVLGQLIPGGMFIVPAIGEAAQRSANRAATRAATDFIGDVSRGGPIPLPPGRNPLVPFTPGVSGVVGGLPSRQ